MSLTAAYQEVLAANRAGSTPIETLAFDHVTFDNPAYILTSGASEDMSLPLVLGGSPTLFTYCPTTVTLPGVTESGPTPMRIRVQNVSNFLLPYLRLAKNSTQPIMLEYRAYAPGDLTQPGDFRKGYRLGRIDLTPEAAEATVTLREIEMQAYPLLMYDRTLFPTLQRF